MISPSHERPRFDPADLFTNRERAKAQFLAALDDPHGPTRYQVLNWWGVGGQGKTALLEEFARILGGRHKLASDLLTIRPGFALIDFRNPTNRFIAIALLSIREQLRKTAGLHCETFETAVLRYLMMTQPGTSLNELKAKYFTTGSEVLDEIIKAISQAGALGAAAHGLPGFSLLSKYASKGAGKAAREFHKWWTRRGERVWVEIETLSQDALLRKLPTYLGADLMDALADDQRRRITIMLDTYEALWHGQGLRDGPGALRIDEWVRHLVQDARGVLFVIAGRNELRWKELDKEWATIIERHPCGGLSRPDAEKLLTKFQILEPDIQARMIGGARSREFGEVDAADNEAEAYLPFYLTLQARDYHNIKAAGGTPATDDFGGEHPEILARFLEHLDPETDKLLRLASYPSALDPTMLDVLAERFLGGRAQADWSRINGGGLASEDKDGTRYLHDLLRQALQERERRERLGLYRDIHRFAFAGFAQRCDESDPKAITEQHERAFLAALRHLSRVDERGAVRWSNQQMQRFDAAARWRALEEACVLVLPIAERAFGGDDQWTTANLSWLALVYRATGRYAEAEQLYERVQAIYEKTLGPEHPRFAPTLVDLAGVYRDTGRYTEAEQLYERVQAIYEKTLGPEHPSFATTLANLALVYSDTGRYARAEQLCKRVRAIREKTLGPEHPDLAATLNNLASIYCDTGRYAEAEQLYERVRAICEKALGPEHPNLAATLNNLALVYHDTGRYTKAEQLYERVRAIEEKALGPEHPNLAATLNNLALVYRGTGLYAEAEQLYERARAIQEKTLGPEHPSFATTLSNLAGVYSDTGCYAEAEQLYERVRAICEKALGPEHPSFATALANLAGVYRDTGRYTKAEQLYERVRAIEEKALGPEHPNLAATLNNLALVYRGTRRYAEAEQLYERVRAIQEKTLGPEHPSFATTLSNLAGVYSDTGCYAEAEQLLDQAMRMYSMKLPERHPRFARLLILRGQLHGRTGRAAEARREFQESIAMLEVAGVRSEHRWMREAHEGLTRLA